MAPAFIVVASWQWWQLICAPLIYGCIFHKVGKCRGELSLSPPAFLSSFSSSSSRCTRTAVLFGATRRSTTVFARPAKDRLLPNTRARELCPPFVNHLDASLIGRPSLPRREQQGGGRACTGSLRGKPLTSPLCPSAIIWPGAERMGQHGE